MKNRNGSVGQASRLSELTWRRHLPHYQLSSGYYFITFSTHDRFILHPPQKDCVFNKANLARQYEDYKWLYLQGWITHDS